ncbi:MAG: hypothetical protein Q7K13_11715 [Polynucleobacter sp.]|uniref:hypothetical protein n=1 Tax=Polynucleobacter sp. TaxID=2029855 RepID=UPI0027287F72|nr:hypothetical protein [Polynucleobacter sp.]MDO8715117.1 hypothetical protein [Polynucleobacter sp.]
MPGFRNANMMGCKCISCCGGVGDAFDRSEWPECPGASFCHFKCTHQPRPFAAAATFDGYATEITGVEAPSTYRVRVQKLLELPAPNFVPAIVFSPAS